MDSPRLRIPIVSKVAALGRAEPMSGSGTPGSSLGPLLARRPSSQKPSPLRRSPGAVPAVARGLKAAKPSGNLLKTPPRTKPQTAYSSCCPSTVQGGCRSKKGKVKCSDRGSVVSDALRPHGLYSPWNSPGQNTGVGSLSLLQGIFPTQGSNRGLLPCSWILYQQSSQGSPRR